MIHNLLQRLKKSRSLGQAATEYIVVIAALIGALTFGAPLIGDALRKDTADSAVEIAGLSGNRFTPPGGTINPGKIAGIATAVGSDGVVPSGTPHLPGQGGDGTGSGGGGNSGGGGGGGVSGGGAGAVVPVGGVGTNCKKQQKKAGCGSGDKGSKPSGGNTSKPTASKPATSQGAASKATASKPTASKPTASNANSSRATTSTADRGLGSAGAKSSADACTFNPKGSGDVNQTRAFKPGNPSGAGPGDPGAGGSCTRPSSRAASSASSGGTFKGGIPGGDLDINEKNGGHALERHVKIPSLLDRYTVDRKGKVSGPSASSKFTNQAVATKAIDQALKDPKNIAAVNKWIDGGMKGNLAVDYETGGIIGESVSRKDVQKTVKAGNPIETTPRTTKTGVNVVLKKNPKGNTPPFIVFTAYPL
jgi:Bacterial CdiA-CT RNAse A domain